MGRGSQFPSAWRPPFSNLNTRNSKAGASTPITIERAPPRSFFATRVPSLPSQAVVKPRPPAARLISDGGLLETLERAQAQMVLSTSATDLKHGEASLYDQNLCSRRRLPVSDVPD